ncbi:hypothetical protein RN001_001274 [Aquatica leii]|uniref:Coiled-coil domain-containing protein 86 n=1 Tax=Aquatica leii TaxID=1421715 RepID=A0AAN7QMP0_9COLE|nr:hypothetical protein RN001_001274 [Aquatica leii]
MNKEIKSNRNKQDDDKYIPRGKPKSGRTWKTTKKRFSSIVKTKGIRDSFEKKQTLRKELERVKNASKAIVALKEEEKEKKKQRRRDNLKRQEENSRKAEIVQIIKNPNKIKRMKKKQLRNIQKRDIDNL